MLLVYISVTNHGIQQLMDNKFTIRMPANQDDIDTSYKVGGALIVLGVVGVAIVGLTAAGVPILSAATVTAVASFLFKRIIA